jgi:hypothetical protein
VRPLAAVRSVQLQVTSGNQGPFEYNVTINDSDWWDSTGILPWTSKATLPKAGSHVSLWLWTTPFDTRGPVTCEIISDGRVVARESQTGNYGPNRSARV